MSGGTWRPESFRNKAYREGTWNATGNRISMAVPVSSVVLVDESSGRPTRKYDDLTREQRERFDRQLAAWRAACALADAASECTKYGLTIHPDRITAWDVARSNWERTRTR